MPSSMPSSRPSGQPSGQPSSVPTIIPLYEDPTGQPTSRPSDFRSNPLFVTTKPDNSLNSMNTQTAIIVFSCIGAIVLCLFIVFTCYFQDKYHNRKEEEKLHSLVEHHYNEDEVILDDGEGTQLIQPSSNHLLSHLLLYIILHITPLVLLFSHHIISYDIISYCRRRTRG